MGDVQMDGPEGPRVTGPEEMVGRFHAELIVAVPVWKQRLAEDPKRFVGAPTTGFWACRARYPRYGLAMWLVGAPVVQQLSRHPPLPFLDKELAQELPAKLQQEEADRQS